MHVDDTSMLEYIADRFKIGWGFCGIPFSSLLSRKKMTYKNLLVFL